MKGPRISMKKYLLIMTVFILSGCSYFNQEPESLTTNVESQQTSNSEVTDTGNNTEEISPETNQENSELAVDNSTFDNVFDESIVGQDRYPHTMLPNDIPIADLRTAIDEYYAAALTEEDKALNFEKVDPETLETLQTYFSENEIFSQLDITVDQVEMTLDGQTNFIARIVIDMPYDDAEQLIEDNDILVLNESMAQLENRLVLVAYHDEEAEELLPYHLTNSTHSLFSLRQRDEQTPSSSSLEVESTTSNDDDSNTESE